MTKNSTANLNQKISESSVNDYFTLMKPRVVFLVVFTALCGILLAPGHAHPVIIAVALISIALGSGAAAVINMWYDSDIDSIMIRTKERPIVLGIIKPSDALAFGIIIGILSITLMALYVNMVSTIILIIAMIFYVVIYTIWLKRKSIQNIVIGGVSGALAPVIGWTSITNNISWEPILLFLIIFFWTPTHSWALALYQFDDYNSVKIPMMPIIKGRLYTKKNIYFYSLLTTITSVIPYFYNMVNIAYLLVIILINYQLMFYSHTLFNKNKLIPEKKLFLFSIFYLFCVFLSLILFKK